MSLWKSKANDVKATHVHFVGVGGVGTGSFATALAASGYRVSGSDGTLYEPMKSVLERANIELVHGYAAGTAELFHPDFVVIGNVIRRDNPEAQAWMRRGVPFVSFPEAVRRFLVGDRRSVVIAGTHGKTTTTTLMTYLLDRLGLSPSYLIGGVPKDLPQGCLLRDGNYFVVEGDEYDSAFFDKGPKFLHYDPDFVILTSIEFDHADIYRDLDHVISSFEKLMALVPGDGLVAVCADDEVARRTAALAHANVESYGFHEDATWRIVNVTEDETGYHFGLLKKGRPAGQYHTKMLGRHNLANITATIAVAHRLWKDAGKQGEAAGPIAEALSKFQGVRRRQELLLEHPIRLVDDFAHHPTAVQVTLDGIRKRYPNGRLWAFFEPRSATARRAVHQEDYARAFDAADVVLLAAPYKAGELGAEKLDAETLAEKIRARGKEAAALENADAILARFLKEYAPGDVAVVMSNGEFGKLQVKLVSALSGAR